MTLQILNQNSLDYVTQKGSKTVDCIITDPPYDFDLVTKKLYQNEFERICKGNIIIFCPPENQWFPERAKQILFWVKPISTKNTSKSYSRFVEMIMVFGDGTWNADRHWSQYTNVFTDLVESKEHPYKKPLSLMTRLVLNHTNPFDTVLDPFMGSGTVGEVCSLNHRSYIGIERDPEYFTMARLAIQERAGKIID
jgi:site-specific DNA-methyltransferase (adenine-specific)